MEKQDLLEKWHLLEYMWYVNYMSLINLPSWSILENICSVQYSRVKVALIWLIFKKKKNSTWHLWRYHLKMIFISWLLHIQMFRQLKLDVQRQGSTLLNAPLNPLPESNGYFPRYTCCRCFLCYTELLTLVCGLKACHDCRLAYNWMTDQLYRLCCRTEKGMD